MNCIKFKLFVGFKKIEFKFVEKNSIRVFLLELGTRIEKCKKEVFAHNYPPGTKSSLFMNHNVYLTTEENMFQISSESV